MFHRTRRLAEKVLRRMRSGVPTRSLEEWESKHEPLVVAAVERILPHLPEGGLFLDIGANVGAFSRVLRELRPDARGILFEPVAKYAAICRERFADDDHIEVVNIALGDENGQRTIFKAPHNYGANSLVQEIMHDRRPEAFVRPDTVIEEETITLRRVADFLTERGIEHVDVVKSDTEGYDYAVLDGLRPWIERTGCFPVVLAEVLQEDFHPLVEKQRAALEAMFQLGYGRVDVGEELNWLVGDVLLLPPGGTQQSPAGNVPTAE
ncbi:2-O-methyltransferase NoeI [Planctomycetes bacterium Poly30]|uniref:2-O-methyltransferase NoeI n=1 Tax=Saltatorellus ferox TaxID=2528018 RepID=A0A518ESS7_9BACT|nr:2-O-methyltransferase NoeI [Planctomycetes bacterium Poly30]